MVTLLSRLRKGISSTRNPSAVLIVGTPPTKAYVLHVVQEDGTVERFAYMCSSNSSFRGHNARERSREQLGIIILYTEEDERPDRFLEDVGARVKDLLHATTGGFIEEDATLTTDHVLRSAALAVIRSRADQRPRDGAGRTYPVFLVRIDRPKPGKIITDADLKS